MLHKGRQKQETVWHQDRIPKNGSVETSRNHLLAQQIFVSTTVNQVGCKHFQKRHIFRLGTKINYKARHTICYPVV